MKTTRHRRCCCCFGILPARTAAIAAALTIAASATVAMPVRAQLFIEQLNIQVTAAAGDLPSDSRISTGPGVPTFLTAIGETENERAFALQSKGGFFEVSASSVGYKGALALTQFHLVVSTDTPNTPLILDFDFLGAQAAGTAYYGAGDMAIGVSQRISAGFDILDSEPDVVETPGLEVVWSFLDSISLYEFAGPDGPDWEYIRQNDQDIQGIGLPSAVVTDLDNRAEFTTAASLDVAAFHGTLNFGLLQPGQTFTLEYKSYAQIVGTLTYPYRGPLSGGTAHLIDPFSLNGGNPPPQLSLRGLALPSAQVAAAAPEPATLALLGMGLLPVAGAVIRRRRRRKV